MISPIEDDDFIGSKWSSSGSRPVSSNTTSSRRLSRPTSSRFKLRIPSRSSITSLEPTVSVATTPKLTSQPQAFLGVKPVIKKPQVIRDIPFHIELKEAPLYIEKEILQRVLQGIESLLRLVKQGNPPEDPIEFLALNLKPSGSVHKEASKDMVDQEFLLDNSILETVDEV